MYTWCVSGSYGASRVKLINSRANVYDICGTYIVGSVLGGEVGSGPGGGNSP